VAKNVLRIFSAIFPARANFHPLRCASRDRILDELFALASPAAASYHTAYLFPTNHHKETFMHMHSLNWLAILVAAIASIILGFVWYSPLLFARPWTREMGYDLNDKAKMDEMRKHAGPAYAGSFVAALIAAFTLALILHGMRAETLHFGLMASFHIWLGFVATVQFTGALFARQSMKLFAINTGYQLVCYLVMGMILALWK